MEKIALSLTKLREQGDFRFTRRSDCIAVNAYGLAGRCELSANAQIDIPQGVFLLVINVDGTLLLRCRSEDRWTIATKGTVAFLPGPRNLIASFGRGDHETDLIWWSESLTPQIGAWLKADPTLRTPNRVVNCRSISPTFDEIVGRIEQALEERSHRQEMLFLSAVYELVPCLANGTHELRLAPLPTHLPAQLRDIARQVADKPHFPWAIRDAAALAGYSPFHFSRVFKQLVGYGFHQYVDRCRTELAARKLCSSKDTIEEVARQCGFGTSHSLRDSIREYLGVTPTELRTTNDAE
ncbi:MAG: helix-turn-helix transcriptional regulator [Chthonomonadaceae bacterium]|nr:helix-turn-helix transcriptional regulator [Chthonomonadaceae bacterium]